MKSIRKMILVVLLVFFSFVNCNDIQNTEDELIFAQVIFRHGDRTIRKPYPNDPWKDKSNWPEGWGQLTNAGKQREYELGKFLKRRYSKLLGGDSFSPDKLHVLSSDRDRTINSANLVLAGMFPPKNEQVWNNNLLWQPIAVHSIPRKHDYYLYVEDACARYLKARLDYEVSPEIRALIEPHKELFEYIEKHAGTPIRTMENMKDVYETLNIERKLNKTIPSWAEQLFRPDSVAEKFAIYWFKLISGTNLLKQLRSGFLLQQMIDRFQNKINLLLPEQILQIWSAHDITIASMLNTFGLFELNDLHFPPYSSSLMFELYKSNHSDSNNDSHYIQIFYRNSTVEDLTPLKLPGCEIKCTLNQFSDLYKDILMDDLNECKLKDE